MTFPNRYYDEDKKCHFKVEETKILGTKVHMYVTEEKYPELFSFNIDFEHRFNSKSLEHYIKILSILKQLIDSQHSTEIDRERKLYLEKLAIDIL